MEKLVEMLRYQEVGVFGVLGGVGVLAGVGVLVAVGVVAGVFGVLGGGEFLSTTEGSQLQCCIQLPEGYRVDIQPLFLMHVEQHGVANKCHSVSRAWPFWDKL